MERTILLLILGFVACGMWCTVWCENEKKTGDGTTVDEGVKSSTTGTQADSTEPEITVLDGFDKQQMKDIRDHSEHHSFQAEVDRMMNLIINSLYKNKDIFLRELISNASDALDKIRLLSLTNYDAVKDLEEFAVYIKPVEEDGTLRIIDTGIGMTKNELLTNLGTVAKSGTSDFVHRLTESESESETNDLIGQFGVGFYSAFLVSEKITVVSKHPDDDQHIWESDSKAFTVIKDPRGNTLKRGTEIILHLRPDAEHYLQITKLEELIRRYSQFINFPISIWKDRVVPVEDGEEEEEEEPVDDEGVVEGTEDSDVETEPDEEAQKKKEKKKKAPKTKVVPTFQLVNQVKPIWLRRPSNITEDDYNNFYTAVSKDSEPPLARVHFTAEGEVTFRSILYIPRQSPKELHKNMYEMKDKIRLYVRRVFITDDFADMFPFFFNFVRGIVDSDDLPLNVSREDLQQSKLLRLIKKKLMRKVIDMIKQLKGDDLETFWREYSTNIKLGVVEDPVNRNRLAGLMRFRSSFNENNFTNFNEYMTRMRPNQQHIFYTAEDELSKVIQSPFTKQLVDRGYEVLYCVDPIDEYVMHALLDYEGKKLVNTAKEGLEDKIEASSKVMARRLKDKEAYKNVMEWLEQDMLKDIIFKVTLNDMLLENPCAVVSTTYSLSGNMEKILRAQAYKKGVEATDVQESSRILQLNPRHPLIKELRNRVEDEDMKEDPETRNLALMLYDSAAIRSGFDIKDIADFASRIEQVLRSSVNIPLDEKVEVLDDSDLGEDEEEENEEEDEEVEEAEDEMIQSKKDKEQPASEKTTSGEQETSEKTEL